jgi:ubiquinone/menaquinone biosynthesis C-methylase UbiE
MATFDERAKEWDTDERIERAAAVAEVMADAVPMSDATRVIEVGAGTGLLGLRLAARVRELVLTDPAAGMLEVAAEKVRRDGLSNVRVVQFDLTEGSLPDRFDLLVSLLVLHHVKDTAAAFAGMHDLLVPGGRIAVADLDTEDGTFHSAEAEGIHHLGFDRDDLATLARAAGFEDVETRTATEIVDEGRTYPLFLLTAVRRDGRTGPEAAPASPAEGP